MKRLVSALAVAACMLVAACTTQGADAGPKPQATSNMYNDTDVMFLQMMIVHHGPAAAMLRLAKSRAKTEAVKTLAAAVEVTQADETKTMTERLTGWSEPLTSSAPPDAHAAHGGLPPDGNGQLAALRAASDAEFDRLFLNLFTAYQHHAVELARMEIGGGINTQTIDLATRVDKSRRAQIELMLRYQAEPAR